MQTIAQTPTPYRRQPIRRTLRAFWRSLHWIDDKLHQPRIKPVAVSLFILIVLSTGGLYAASPWYELVVNQSNSLPGIVFFLDKTKVPECGDTTVFKMPAKARFYAGYRLIKIIRGCTGDVVTVEGHEVFINGRSVGTYLNMTSSNKPTIVKPYPLYPIEPKIIPDNKVYLYAPNPRSYDSRYRSYGLRDRSELLGRATRIF
jgi:type IV secretory pathway protease TraF